MSQFMHVVGVMLVLSHLVVHALEAEAFEVIEVLASGCLAALLIALYLAVLLAPLYAAWQRAIWLGGPWP